MGREHRWENGPRNLTITTLRPSGRWQTRTISILEGTSFLAALFLAQVLLGGCGWLRFPARTKRRRVGQRNGVQNPFGKGGAELWAINCAHCHNIRSPNFYNDTQWDMSMMHMRVRANLTADEYRKILAFLKSAD